MPQKSVFAFSRINFILLGVAIAIILLGFVLMSGEGSTESHFNPEIFSTRRIVIAPFVCLVGYLFIIVAILYRPRRQEQTLATTEPAPETLTADTAEA